MKTGMITLFAMLLVGCSSQQVFIHASSLEPQGSEFRYMADAPRIMICATGQSYPVAMKEAYIELERAYLASGVEAGMPVWVSVKGYIDHRPAMGGIGTEEVFIIESFDDMDSGRHCPVQEPLLEGQEWLLIDMPGSSQDVPKDHMPYLQFDEKEKRVSGFAGCNRFFGSYHRVGEQLQMGPLASTRMSCGKLDIVEHSFLEKLEQTDRWQIWERQLKLLKGHQTLLLFQMK